MYIYDLYMFRYARLLYTYDLMPTQTNRRSFFLFLMAKCAVVTADHIYKHVCVITTYTRANECQNAQLEFRKYSFDLFI